MRLLFWSTILYFVSGSAYASVVREEPDCTMDVSIISQKNGEIKGKLFKIRSRTPADIPYCLQFRKKDVLITAYDRPTKQILERLESLTIGVQSFSAMGENGPVRGIHPETVKITVDGKTLSGRGNVPYFEIDFLEIDLLEDNGQ